MSEAVSRPPRTELELEVSSARVTAGAWQFESPGRCGDIPGWEPMMGFLKGFTGDFNGTSKGI